MNLVQRRLIGSSCLLLSIVFTNGAHADGWTLRAGAVWLEPDGELDAVVDGNQVHSRGASDVGLGITIERRFSDRIGLELGAPLISDPELMVRVDTHHGVVSARSPLGTVALTAGVNLYLARARRAEVYIGPFVGMALLDDLETTVDGERLRLTFDDELLYGVVLGVDLPISKRWGAYAAARYFAFDIEPNGDNALSVGFDTLSFGVGLSVGF